MRAGLRIRFCISLPVVFLILSVVLAMIGEAQRSRIAEGAGSRPAHAVADYFATARFIDYAINAPAWAAASNMPHIFHVEDSGWGLLLHKADGWYFFFVVVMWFFIGYRLDAWYDANRIGQSLPPASQKLPLRTLCTVYGIFICYSALRWYAPWSVNTPFGVEASAWGAGLIFAGLYPFSPARSRTWGVFFGILGALVGGLDSWFGVEILLMEHRLARVSSAGVMELVWGGTLVAASLYLLFAKGTKSGS
jgi:hypothetical protein